MSKQDPASAAALFAQAVKLDPNFAAAYASLGKTYLTIGKNTDAMQNLMRAFELRDRVNESEKAQIEYAYEQVRADGNLPPRNGQGKFEVSNEKPEEVNEKFANSASVEGLWAAVQGGSVAAEIALAERFLTGNGVDKNCAQALVLLKAAANRGSREARQRLWELQSRGCSSISNRAASTAPSTSGPALPSASSAAKAGSAAKPVSPSVPPN